MTDARASAVTAGHAPVAVRWVGRLRRAELSGEVAVLIVIGLVLTVCSVLVAQFPISGQAPVTLLRACAGGGALVTLALFALGPRLPAVAVHAALATFVAGASLLTANAHTNGGLMMIARSFPWFAAYAALFLSPRAARAHAAVITVGCVTGVMVAGVPHTRIEALIISITVWVVTTVMSALSERLREQADTDPLTGVLNRNGFTKAATRELALAWRTGNPIALALIDLDGFKDVNDAHGHAAGDRLLAELARIWERGLRPGDLLARHGGDEFVVLFPATTARDARSALERLRGGHDARWSAGVAAWERGEPLGVCLARADARLYEAKAAGGGVALEAALAPVG